MQWLCIEIIRIKVLLVIIDLFSLYFEGEENDNGEMFKIFNSYIKLLMCELNVSVMFIYYIGKDKIRGVCGVFVLCGWFDIQYSVQQVQQEMIVSYSELGSI